MSTPPPPPDPFAPPSVAAPDQPPAPAQQTGYAAPPVGHPPTAPPLTYAAPPLAYGANPLGRPGPPPSDRLATIAVAMSIGALIPLVGVATIVLAIVALVRIGDGRARGKGRAILAIVISLAWLGGIAALVAFAAVNDSGNDGIRDASGTVTSPGVVSTQRLREGDCFLDPGLVGLGAGETKRSSSVRAVPCSQPHDLEVFAVVRVEATSFPGDENIAAQADTDCRARFDSYVGMSFDDSTLDIFYYLPTAGTWSRMNDRTITCSVADGGRATGSLRGARR